MWDSGRIGEGGVRQMQEPIMAGGRRKRGRGGSKRVGSGRNYGLKGKRE